MERTSQRQKLALLINIISPARIALFFGLASRFELLLLHGGNESNRYTWQGMEQLLPNAKVIRAWGWQIRLKRKVNGTAFDSRYLHFTPGYIWHLLRFRPDVMVANEMGLRTLIALAYGTIARKPVWVWWGGTLHTERGVGRVKRLVRRIISRWAKHWISYGNSSTEYLLSLGISRDNVLEIQNAVDERRFAPTSEAVAQLIRGPFCCTWGSLPLGKASNFCCARPLCNRRKAFFLAHVGRSRPG